MLKKISMLLIMAMIIGIFQTGEVFAKAKYDEVGAFSEGLASVRIGDYNTGKYGFINKKGQEVVKPKYDVTRYHEVGNFSEGLARVEKDDKCGYINKKGKEVIKLKYSAANDFSEGIATVREGDNWYIIDKKGKVLRKI